MSVLSDLFQDIADAIRGKTGSTDKMNPAAFPTAIAGIEAGGSADVRYVTFLNHDESALGRKAVAVGDDCADPIARGVFSTPVRASDVQYDYTFAGWATAQGGSANSSALKAVNADRTVYAAYTSGVRYYTITYYDSDGSTVLKTESLAYGSQPTYEPEKEGFGFEGWYPQLTTVTGDASYTAVWAEKLTFANASWEQIKEISESGEAKDYFKVGDTKDIYYGETRMQVMIAGFDHDDLADGSGKAGISVVFNNLTTNTATYSSGSGYDSISSYMNGSYVMGRLPESLQAVIKPVVKRHVPKTKTNSGVLSESDTTTISQKLWALSMKEIGVTYPSSQYSSPALGETYELFQPVTAYTYPEGLKYNGMALHLLVPVAGKTSINTNVTGGDFYWIRDSYRNGYQNPMYVKASNSQNEFNVSFANSNKAGCFRCGFCI